MISNELKIVHQTATKIAYIIIICMSTSATSRMFPSRKLFSNNAVKNMKYLKLFYTLQLCKIISKSLSTEISRDTKKCSHNDLFVINHGSLQNQSLRNGSFQMLTYATIYPTSKSSNR